MTLVYSLAAAEDLESIYSYILDQAGPAVAKKVLYAITGICERLKDYPNLGRRRPELDVLGFEARSIGEQGFLVVYTVHKATVVVGRILHGSQDVGPHLVSGSDLTV